MQAPAGHRVWLPGRIPASLDARRAIGAGLAGTWLKASIPDCDLVGGDIRFREDSRGTRIGEVSGQRDGVRSSPASGSRRTPQLSLHREPVTHLGREPGASKSPGASLDYRRVRYPRRLNATAGILLAKTSPSRCLRGWVCSMLSLVEARDTSAARLRRIGGKEALYRMTFGTAPLAPTARPVQNSRSIRTPASASDRPNPSRTAAMPRPKDAFEPSA